MLSDQFGYGTFDFVVVDFKEHNNIVSKSDETLGGWNVPFFLLLLL